MTAGRPAPGADRSVAPGWSSSLLVAAKLAEAFAEEAGHTYGRLFSNIQTYIQAPHNPRPGYRPWTASPTDQVDDDFWVHNRLIDSVVDYRRGVAMVGDMVIDIADHEFVLTEHHGAKIKIFSPVAAKGLDADPDYRIIGRVPRFRSSRSRMKSTP